MTARRTGGRKRESGLQPASDTGSRHARASRDRQAHGRAVRASRLTSPRGSTRLPLRLQGPHMVDRRPQRHWRRVGPLGGKAAARFRIRQSTTRPLLFSGCANGVTVTTLVASSAPMPFGRRQIEGVGRQRLIGRTGRGRRHARFCGRRNNPRSAPSARSRPLRRADRRSMGAPAQ